MRLNSIDKFPYINVNSYYNAFAFVKFQLNNCPALKLGRYEFDVFKIIINEVVQKIVKIKYSFGIL